MLMKFMFMFVFWLMQCGWRLSNAGIPLDFNESLVLLSSFWQSASHITYGLFFSRRAAVNNLEHSQG